MKIIEPPFLKVRVWGLALLLVLLLAAPAFAQRYTVLPQFASGDGWSSDLFFTNQTAALVTGIVVSFYGDNGSPLSVDTSLGTGTTFTLSLNPGATEIMRVAPAGSLRVGYAVVRAPTSASISVTEVFRFEQGGVVYAELGVAQLARNYNFTFPVEVDLARGINTGLALANPTFDSGAATAQTLVVNLIDRAGVRQRTALVNLGLGAHISKFLNESAFFEGLDNFLGSVSISGINRFGVLPLRQDKLAFGAVAVDPGPVLGPFTMSTPLMSEAEPNNSAGQAQFLAAACLMNGTIGGAGDLDYYYFNGRAGDVVSAIVDTQGLNSQLDSVVRIEKADGTVIVSNDQNGLYAQNDSFLQLVLPEDGRYNLRVSDWYGSGGSNYGYRLHLGFAAGAPPPPNMPQITSLNPNNGTQGSSTTLIIQGTNLSGATSVNFASSTGITISNVQSTATQVTAQLTIAADAPTGTRQVTVTTPAGTSNAQTFTVNPGGGANYDGTWTGNWTRDGGLAGSGTVTITIAGGKIMSIAMGYSGLALGCCTVGGTQTTSFSSGYAITGNAFSVHVTGGPGTLTYTLAGTFTSGTQVSGTLQLTLNAPVYPQPTCCSGSTSATWSATKN